MTVRGAIASAIRRMIRLPRPRARKRQWIGVGIAAVVAGLLAVLAPALAIGAGAIVAVAAVFVAVGRLWGWVALAIGLGLGLGLFPLFGVLGLELSVVVAMFSSIAGADLGCALARELAKHPPENTPAPGRAVFAGALGASGLAVAVALVPGVIAAFRGIVVPTCDWWFGISSYLAMPLASAVLGGAIGFAIGALVGPRRIGPAILAQVPAVFVAGAALYRFYATPPVYTYNALLGYFPGNMYDENVQLEMPLLWSRLEQLAWVIAAVAAVAWWFDVGSWRVRKAPRPAGRRRGAIAITGIAALAALALRCNGGTLGFAVDADDLEADLGARIETPHFVIYYSPTPAIVEDLPLIVEDHEFRYSQVVATLGVEPDHKLVSFLFASRDQKARLHGSRDVEMAKPWRGEIYLDHRTFPHHSLRHEIAHAIAAEFGDPVFHVASRRVLGIPMLAVPGLIEGLAVAVDWPGNYDRPSPHELVRVIQKLGSLPSLDTLFSLQFFSVSSAQGYTTAGSFIKFLLDRYGAAKLRELYRSGGDFEGAYGVSRDELEKEWRAMLETIDVRDAMVEAQKERFRRTSVFARPCAHAIAKRSARAAELAGRGDLDGAVALMREVCQDSLGDPRYRLALANLLYVDDTDPGHQIDRDEAVGDWLQLAVDDRNVTVSVRERAFRYLARDAVARGDLAGAARLLAFARTMPLDDTERRSLDAMAILARPYRSGRRCPARLLLPAA